MNIILQHWDGDLNELAEASVENIKAYANTIGADYELVRGKPFREHLTSPCQKVFCIDEKWDSYDSVLMLDPDVFIRKNLTKNIFKESGNGIHGTWQIKLKRKLILKNYITEDTPYWAGSIYKFNKDERKSLRDEMPKDDSWLDFFNKAYHFEDEGILSVLAGKAKLKTQYLDFKWNQCSYLPKPEDSYIIHIRTKKPGHLNGTWENGGKQDKIINYKELLERNIL